MTRRLAAPLALLVAFGQPSWAGPVARVVVRPATVSVGAAGAVSLPAPSLGRAPSSLTPAPSLAASLAPVPSAPAQGPSSLPALDAASAAGAQRWDLAAAAPSRAAAVMAAASDAPSPGGLSAPGAAQAAPARRVPAPPVLLSRSGQAAAWAGLTGLAALAHYPFENLGVLAVAAVMGVFAGFVSAFWAAAAQQDSGWGGAPAPVDRPIPDAERDAARAEVDALAREAGLPAPKRFSAYPYSDINAQAGGAREESEVVVYGGVLDLPPGARRAVLRHEIAHLKHGDSSWSGLNFALVALPVTIGLLAGAVGDWRALAAAPLLVSSLYLLGRSRKADEFHADQYAAHRDGAPVHMVAALRAIEAQDALRAPQPPKNAWQSAARRAGAVWKKARRLWAAHPTHEQRIARLERLGR